jgi:KUP system potassium uptake protein
MDLQPNQLSAAVAPATAHHPSEPLPKLMLGAVGVVYGDIGTSPLYAFRESIAHVVRERGAATKAEVIGVISLKLWAQNAIVTLK